MPGTYVVAATQVQNNLECNIPAGFNATFPSAGTYGPLDRFVYIGWWYDSTTSTFTPPAGMTTRVNRLGNHTNVVNVAVCSGLLVGASPPASLNASGTAENDYNNSAILVVRDLDTITDFDKGNGNSGQSGTVTWTGQTPARNGSLGIAVHGGYNNPCNAIGSTPTATERINALDGVNDVFTIPMNTTDTASRTATKTSDTWVAVYIILQPPASAAQQDPLFFGFFP